MKFGQYREKSIHEVVAWRRGNQVLLYCFRQFSGLSSGITSASSIYGTAYYAGFRSASFSYIVIHVTDVMVTTR